MRGNPFKTGGGKRKPSVREKAIERIGSAPASKDETKRTKMIRKAATKLRDKESEYKGGMSQRQVTAKQRQTRLAALGRKG